MNRATIISIKEYYMGRLAKRKIEEDSEINKPTLYIGTGSDVLDMVVGGGKNRFGYPAGAFINIVGDKSSSKTFCACEIIAAGYHKYKEKCKWVYDDCESGFGFDTKSLYGFEIMPENPRERFKSKTVQEMESHIWDFIRTIKEDEFGIYVVDSLDGLSSDELEKIADKRHSEYLRNKGKEEKDNDEKEEKDKKGKGSYKMESAKFLSQDFFRTLTDDIKRKNVLVIFVSQIRYNMDPFSFEKYTRAGGKALDFYAYCVLWLAKIHEIEKRSLTTGIVVLCDARKLKAPRPYRKCQISFIFDYGLDNVGTNIDYLFDLRGARGELLKAAKSIEWKSGEDERTREELINYIEENSLQIELKNRVIEKWEERENSVATVRKSKYGEDNERNED